MKTQLCAIIVCGLVWPMATRFGFVSAVPDYDLAASARAEANEFLDNLLLTQLPRVLIDRPERLRNFSCHIRKRLFGGVLPTHRDIHANFTDGTLNGLLGIRRLGDCQPAFEDDRYVVVSCKVDIGSLRINYSSSVQGFDIWGSIAQPQIEVDFEGSSLTFEAKQMAPDRPHLSTLAINMMRSNVHYRSLGFNSERDRLFRQHILRSLLPQVFDLINGRLRHALQDALRQESVLLPEVRVD